MSLTIDEETYQELRRIASIRMRSEKAGHTLSPTALVNELYLRRHAKNNRTQSDRLLFLATAAHEMRQILVDHARTKKAIKRGSGITAITLIEDQHSSANTPEIDILSLNYALDKLGQKDSSKLHIIEMRYFSGLTLEEIAQELDLSLSTVKRRWTAARAWLFRELSC